MSEDEPADAPEKGGPDGTVTQPVRAPLGPLLLALFLNANLFKKFVISLIRNYFLFLYFFFFKKIAEEHIIYYK